MFAYNNSVAQGRRMVADFSKLLLRAYNAEADNQCALSTGRHTSDRRQTTQRLGRGHRELLGR